MSDHDNDTCPHLVRASLLEAENARLKADAQLVVKHLGEACADNLRLKADVVELADALKLASEVGIKVADEVTRLKAEVERLKIDAYKKLSMRIEIDKLKARIEYLTNAGDFMADAINGDYNHELPCVKAWNAAKEGKPSV